MMTSRSDYALVSPPQGITIDGGIMPARDVADDGSWRHLRGEDVCFLSEAASRMTDYRHYADNGFVAALAPSREVKASDMAACVSRIHAAADYSGVKYVFAKTPMVRGEFVTDVGGTDGLTVALASLMPDIATTPTFYASTSDFTRGSPLVADNLRKAWYDARKLGAILSVGSMFAAPKSGGRFRTHYPTSTPPETTPWIDLSRAYNTFRAWKGYGGVWELNNGWEEYEFSVGEVKPIYLTTSTPLSFASGDDALVLFSVETRHGQMNIAGTFENETRYTDALACFGTLDGNGILQMRALGGGDLTASRINSLIFAARPSLPSNFDALAYGMGINTYLTPVAVFFYDQDLDTSAIDWRWTPT